LKSLERRFALHLALALLAVFGLLFWSSIAAVRSLSEAYVLARLEHDAEALLGAFGINPRGLPRLRQGRISPVYQQPLSGHYFLVSLADGAQIRSRSLWDETLGVPDVEVGVVETRFVRGPAEQQLYSRSAGYEKHGQRFTLTVAEDLTPMARDIRRFQWIGLIALGVALTTIVTLQRYLLRRGFRVLDQVRGELRQVAMGQLRQIEELGPIEIRPLSTEVNRLLQQLQKRLQRSRQALGNLAHGLKAPLSLMTRDLDTLPLADADRQRLSTQLNRVGTLIERELKRARFGGDSAAQPFIPRADVPDLLDALRQLYRGRDLDIVSLELPETALPFDHEDMLELLGNLLDNACKWARRRVELNITLDHGVLISVADDGHGIPGALGETLLQRGTRIDEQEDGHGLGLAIVKDLVNDYSGTIEFIPATARGGLQVRVRLPTPGDMD